jgi:hypothetical protein
MVSQRTEATPVLFFNIATCLARRSTLIRCRRSAEHPNFGDLQCFVQLEKQHWHYLPNSPRGLSPKRSFRRHPPRAASVASTRRPPSPVVAKRILFQSVYGRHAAFRNYLPKCRHILGILKSGCSRRGWRRK